MPRLVSKTLTAKQRAAATKRHASSPKTYFDPTPEIQGTDPEKIVINRLLYMGIPFVSQGYVTINIPELDLNKDYRPDILIPDIKLIIQIQGAYWHSSDAQIEADAYLNALYEAVGYRVIDWWDFDILTNLDALFASEPELVNWAYPRGGRITTGYRQSNIDDTKGIATVNKRRAKGAKAARVGRRKLRKPISKHLNNRLQGSRVK